MNMIPTGSQREEKLAVEARDAVVKTKDMAKHHYLTGNVVCASYPFVAYEIWCPKVKFATRLINGRCEACGYSGKSKGSKTKKKPT